MIADLLARLADPRPLSAPESRRVLDRLVAPSLEEAERPALLLALSARPSDPAELAHLAAGLRARARPFPHPARERPVDLCGSGGAPRASFNVSTASAFVVAAAGVPVLKHGNRSARGRCGSSDLLLALGLPVDRNVAFARACYDRERLAFLHAPLFHPVLARLADARRILGVPTVLNRLGPLAHPAGVTRQVTGVPTPGDTGPTAAALRALGVRRGVTMASADGRDEFSPRRTTHAVFWSGSSVRRRRIDPSRFLLGDERTGSWAALPPADAAEETDRIFAGGGGARRGSILLTSGAALWAAGTVPSFAAGVARAREALDGGGAEEKLAALRAIAERFRGTP
ncbi:Anthranilate phosphoribosyltransferase [mine drainage metagenome]|uniref:Anthranilate phosphoribosyltransferase n=2 Tax=mine drainage metagenome TaxID=410659 RepID=T1AU97_9ZZZZ